MKVYPCHHVHLFCTDLEATLAFWQQGFGLPLVRRRLFGNDPGAELDLGKGILLSVVQRSKDKRDNSVVQSGIDHLGMLVDDVEETLRHLACLPNVRIARKPFMSEKYQCAFVSGPDDVLVEIQALKG